MVNEREQRPPLEKELALLKAIIDSSAEGMVIVDKEARIIVTNPVMEQAFARPVPYGQPFESHAELNFVHLDGRHYKPRELPLTRSALDGETFTGVKMATSAPNGKRREFLVNTAPLRDDEGVIIGAVGVFRGMTERENLDEEIRESRRQVLDILESISDGFFALDTLWRFTYINGRAQQFLGLRKEDVLFRGIWDKLPNAQVLRLYKELNQAVERQEATVFEDFIAPPNKWFEFHVYPYKHGASVYFSDVTGRKRDEEALQTLNRRFDEVLNRLSDGFIILDKEWRHVFVNDKAAADVHLAKEDMLGRVVWELFPELVGTPLEREYRRAAREHIPIVFERYSAELDIWVELRAFPFEEGIAVFGRDITAQKRIPS